MSELLYGRNAVREALRAHRRRFELMQVSAGAQETGTLADVIKLAEQANIPIERIDRRMLDKQVRDANHQGVILTASDYPYAELDECLARADEQREPALLLLLDHLQDPQNIGTLLRTAEVVGVHGVLLPTRRAAGITAAVVNASSGATEHLLIVTIGNLAQTIVELQRSGIWVVGLEDDPEAALIEEVDFKVPLALVVGAEGSGLARLTRERCDYLVRLPMRGHIQSLNAAVAGSVALYHAFQTRGSHTHTGRTA
ncbi:MAG: 23S rRNA (guanosine(2251)-2'-O)-methyltransferase RlmB [Chloroflexaceae bacterium]|nr:23S rRNA (guanosine(2251)-2'-O)-methyltransferase RlmB [Chloroflexaceae bacterium]NJO05009.1 23S rRNA (guanosine(2251)-2'-O)-methyltransferase RlmB [Chloroflexaceae bacterium]